MPFYVYVLKSTGFNRRYIGGCEDLNERLRRDNAGKVRSIKAYKPYMVIFLEEYPTRTEALKREHFFKSPDEYNFLMNKGVIDGRAVERGGLVAKGALREKPHYRPRL